ncbi:MAG: hypothetical protein IJ876_00190, partial [Elusimicrobiaceae bacterium]|nr:hypothetical protein [Elusimicrobiaceae bacterium]
AVPQYQQAVLKSRYKTLMLPTKSINSGNEVYYLAHGYYADRLKELDVDFNSEDEKTLVKLSDDLEYAYVLSTRSDLANNYIMYQQHSMNYPGEIHCEALTEDEKANKLCKLLGGEEIAGSQTSGYKTYILEGTGNGFPPGVNSEGANCDNALSKGFACTLTENKDGSIHKKVCQSVGTNANFCIDADYDKDGNITFKSSCVQQEDGICHAYNVATYDKNGNRTFYGFCDNMFGGVQNSDGSCKQAYSGDFYWYDNQNHMIGSGCAKWGDNFSCLSVPSQVMEYDAQGNKISQKSCVTWNSDGITCDLYGTVAINRYDSQGNKTFSWECMYYSANHNSDGSCKRANIYEYETKQSEDGTKSQITKTCATADMQAQSCNTYSSVKESIYDVNGNILSTNSCLGSNINRDTGSCNAWTPSSKYEYDEQGRLTNSTTCSSGSSLESCSKNISNISYEDDGSYTKVSCIGGNCTNGKYTEANYDSQNRILSSETCTNYNSDGACTNYQGTSYKYIYDDAKGTQTVAYCNTSLNTSTGQCNKYDGISDVYFYDSDGNKTGRAGCSSWNEDGSCTKYGYRYQLLYDEDGKLITTDTNNGIYCQADPNTGSCISSDWVMPDVYLP